jgi:hypothetical protein
MKLVTSRDVINFIKEHVIHRFGIPQTITTDEGQYLYLMNSKSSPPIWGLN